MSNKRKRKTYEETSVFVYQEKGETAEAAKQRLAAAWKRGEHPMQQKKEQA